jgi:hypothetical protein
MSSYSFKICPKCKAGYCLSNTEYNDHVSSCNSLKDIICPRFYTYNELTINNNINNHYNKCNQKVKIIEPYIIKLS